MVYKGADCITREGMILIVVIMVEMIMSPPGMFHEDNSSENELNGGDFDNNWLDVFISWSCDLKYSSLLH